MRVYHCDQHEVPLPAGHRFPMGKYARLRGALIAEGVLAPAQLCPSPQIGRADLERVHDPAYVAAILDGTLDDRAQRKLGFPWSRALVTRSNASAGGTLAAARAALEHGLAGNLAGGTHHAHRSHGSGFCVWNDLAIAAAALLAEGRVRRVLVFDVDVHQGDGTAQLFAGDDRVFTCSLHGAHNFPFEKQRSDLDLELPDRADDAAVLAAIAQALVAVGTHFDLVLYQGGVDALAADKLGRLGMTVGGLRARDRLALGHFRAQGLPVALTLGGGYADPIELSIAAHVNTYREAMALASG